MHFEIAPMYLYMGMCMSKCTGGAELAQAAFCLILFLICSLSRSSLAGFVVVFGRSLLLGVQHRGPALRSHRNHVFDLF